jgi:AcrR family transcriptional regulator
MGQMAASRSASVRPTTSASSRDAILDAAERLFAERGARAVSLREINAAAGFSPTALYHHFRTRDALMKALLGRRRPAILERRKEMLTRLSLNPRPSLYEIIEAMVRPMAVPLLQDPVRGNLTLRVLARLYFERDYLTREAIEEGIKCFLPHLKTALPNIPEPILIQRWLLAAELTVQALANISNLNVSIGHRGAQTPATIERYLHALTVFLGGGLRGIDEAT